MKTRFILFLLFLSGLVGVVSFWAILTYMDPYVNIPLAIGLLLATYFISGICLGSIVLYIGKKIYFRGSVGMFHVFSSMRQAFFLCVLGTIGIILKIYSVPFLIPFFLSMVLLVLLELFFKTLR